MAVDTTIDVSNESIRSIAQRVIADWKSPYFGARPYLEAMLSIERIEDRYIAEDGRSIVRGFLANAQAYKGPTARAVKAELRKRLGR